MVHILYKIYKRLTDHDQNPFQCADYTIILYNMIFCNHVIYEKIKNHIARIKPLNPYLPLNPNVKKPCVFVSKSIKSLKTRCKTT